MSHVEPGKFLIDLYRAKRFLSLFQRSHGGMYFWQAGSYFNSWKLFKKINEILFIKIVSL